MEKKDPQKFKGGESFLALLIRMSARSQYVVARSYGHGAWLQFSGRDLSAHLGRVTDYWEKSFSDKKEGTVLFLGRNTYGSFVTGLGISLAGFNVMFMPSQASEHDISWCVKYFNCFAIATDQGNTALDLKVHEIPVINISRATWGAEDTFEEPRIFKAFRDYKTSGSASDEMPQVGQFQFISFGNDGFQKPESLNPDVLVLTAQNFILHSNVPPSVQWKSVELLQPSNPFAHLSRFCALLKNGVMGFPDTSATWETNLRILRPTYCFANPQTLTTITEFVDSVSQRFKSRIFLGNQMEKARELLGTSRALKLPESLFVFAKRTLRQASRMSVGTDFVKEAVEDLRFVVHGLEPAASLQVHTLERLGVPVLETYGTTATAGMLSANTYDAPHFNLIGGPLPHVSFRLGADSTLEFRVSHPQFVTSGKWQKTGDVANMTPHGFAITGRKRHLFVTTGGVVVSPIRIESEIRQHEPISDVCLVGDKLPFLAALIVLKNEAYADYKQEPEKMKDTVQEIMSKINDTLPRNATIKKFAILDKPFQDKLGEKLPTGGINRLRIHQTREAIIESLYANVSA